MAAPARPTLPLTCWTRLARSGGPGWARTAAILERGAVVRPAPIYRGLSIQLASRHRAVRLYQTLLACSLACSLACLPAYFPAYLPAYLEAHLAAYFAAYLPAYLLARSLPVCLLACLLLLSYLFTRMPAWLRLFLPVSVCLSLFPSVPSSFFPALSTSRSSVPFCRYFLLFLSPRRLLISLLV